MCAPPLASSFDVDNQKTELNLKDPQEELRRLSAELTADAKAFLEEIERLPYEKDVWATLDGLCVGSPAFIRLKRVSNVGARVVYAQIAKEFTATVAAACPEAASIVVFQEYVSDIIDSIIFLMQYADEYLDLVTLGLDKPFLDTVVFESFKEKALASRLILKKAAVDLELLRVKNFGQLNGLVHRLLLDMTKRFSVIASDDLSTSMREVELLEDSFENFFALCSVAEQEVLGAFVQAVKDALGQNKMFIAAAQRGKNYLYSSSSSQSVTGI